ncbi:4Fe-4S single cluster domain-containing protein [Nannocystis bainbridge]|uniref:4Fe-4S single cluster domain-containing protein n=1 Tax=Nannocystis bainbridge TaxID=2995303 RepID=A0ABT5DXW5_9BACT|nr:4Fe-4S single cluster domain-containing protein [Nannocystis bainbridge]MDC0718462.1 4Fe-4S single cluster domain-containing protein [Nannocystis bainbridge]
MSGKPGDRAQVEPSERAAATGPDASDMSAGTCDSATGSAHGETPRLEAKNMSAGTCDSATDSGQVETPRRTARKLSAGTCDSATAPRRTARKLSAGTCDSATDPQALAANARPVGTWDSLASPVTLRVAARVACTEAEGPGLRFAVWVQGCTLRCPGCCNPELFARDGGEALAITTLVDELRAARDLHAITGLTVLGGEPSEQPEAVAALCRAARELGLGTLVFTGRTHAELQAMPGARALLDAADTLVDGRFDARRREPAAGRRWIGSTNQQIVHLTPRHADPALWRGRDHVELQIDASGRLTAHGAPDLLRRVLKDMS